MAPISFVTAWRRDDPKLAADANAFWTGVLQLPADKVGKRTNELCSMAYCDGRLVGVSTVNFMEYPPYKSRFAYYRVAVDPDFRRRELAILLTRHTLITMEGWSHEHPEEKLQGLLTVLEGKELSEKALNPVWGEYYGNLNLAGFTQWGDQVRIAWFRHARLEASAAG